MKNCKSRFYLIIVAMVCISFLSIGCAAFNQFLCSPTNQQTEAANVGLSLAQAALVAIGVYTGNPVVTVISQQAIPIFEKVRQGYCVTQAEWDQAVTAVASTSTAKAVGEAPAIEFLQSIKWGK
jgi:hypothetical protein